MSSRSSVGPCQRELTIFLVWQRGELSGRAEVSRPEEVTPWADGSNFKDQAEETVKADQAHEHVANILCMWRS